MEHTYHPWSRKGDQNLSSISVSVILEYSLHVGALLMAQTVKKSACNARDTGLIPGLGRNKPWRRKWQPTPEFLPREFHGQRSLEGYSPWGHKELNMTEWLMGMPWVSVVDLVSIITKIVIIVWWWTFDPWVWCSWLGQLRPKELMENSSSWKSWWTIPQLFHGRSGQIPDSTHERSKHAGHYIHQALQ